MNIKKGMDRIALILAIVAIVPGALMGGAIVFENCKTETPEHKAWQKKVEGWYQANPNWDKGSVSLFEPWRSASNYYPSEEWKEPRPINSPRPIWQILLGGIVAAPLSFFIVLFGIRGTTRLVIFLVIFVVAGFRDKSEKYRQQ